MITIKRIVNIKIEYNVNLSEYDVIPKEKCEEMIKQTCINDFCWDEGFEDIKVEVVDEE